MFKSINKPQGVFRGVNFMTPEIIGYYKLRRGFGYVEFSEGTGFLHEPIFGVAIRPLDRNGKDRGSKMFFSKREALNYIEKKS